MSTRNLEQSKRQQQQQQQQVSKQSRDGSQSNREKLYKRFKKLNKQVPAGQTRSQKQLGCEKNEKVSPSGKKTSSSKPKVTMVAKSDHQADYIHATQSTVSPANAASMMNERANRSNNMPCQSPPSHSSKQQQLQRLSSGQHLPSAGGQYIVSAGVEKQPTISIQSHGNVANFPFKQHSQNTMTAPPSHQQQAFNQEHAAMINEYFSQPVCRNGRNSNRATKSTSSAKVNTGTGQLKSYSESMNSNHPVAGTLGEGLTLSSSKIFNSLNCENGNVNNIMLKQVGGNPSTSAASQALRQSLQYQPSAGRATQMNKSQSSEQSSIYPIQMRQRQPQGFKTSQNSHTNLFADNSTTQKHVLQRKNGRPQTGTDDIQIHQTMSLNSDMDLNPLNDSHMMQISNQVMKKSPLQGVQFNQSSVTQQEAASFSGYYELPPEDIANSDCSLWLTEDMHQAQAQYAQGEDRQQRLGRHQQFMMQPNGQINHPQQHHHHQHHQQRTEQKANSYSPDNMNPSSSLQKQLQLALVNQLRLQTQETDSSHQAFMPTRYTTSHDYQEQPGIGDGPRGNQSEQSNHYQKILLTGNQKSYHNGNSHLNNSGMTPMQKQKMLLHKNGGVPQQQHSYRSTNLVNTTYQPHTAYNTSRHSHQNGATNMQNQVSGEEQQMRASFQGPLPSHVLQNQLQMGLGALSDIEQCKRTERSQQVSLAQFRDSHQLQHGLNKTVNSSRMRSSERNQPLLQGHPQQQNDNYSQIYGRVGGAIPSKHQLNQTADQNQSCFERGKYSTRTNPYQNLLSSHFVGSTAPSATMDQLTASHVNSCSQFAPGNYTIATGKMTHGLGCTISGGTVVTQTLEGLVQDTNTSCENMLDSGINQQLLQPPNPQSLAVAYTDKVAQSLLAQIKPGILKLIQKRIEVVVQELCDEGFYDQSTIMRVLETRASKLFPENFMVNALDLEQEQNLAAQEEQVVQQLPSDLNHLTAPQSIKTDYNHLWHGASGPKVMNSNNQSQIHDLQMNRSVNSDTMLSQVARNLDYQRRSNVAKDSIIDQSSELRSTAAAQQHNQQDVERNTIEEVNSQQVGLNTTEKMIKSIQQTQYESNGHDNHNVNYNTAESQNYPQMLSDESYIQQQHQQMQQQQPRNTNLENNPLMGDPRVADSVQDTGAALSTERLVSDIRAANNHGGTSGIGCSGQNFNSHKIQQSDDFKITFAYTSQKSSSDFDQFSQKQQHHLAQQQSKQGGGVLPASHLQLKQENLVSFNPNDNNLVSPVMSTDHVVDNIRNFSQQRSQLQQQQQQLLEEAYSDQQHTASMVSQPTGLSPNAISPTGLSLSGVSRNELIRSEVYPSSGYNGEEQNMVLSFQAQAQAQAQTDCDVHCIQVKEEDIQNTRDDTQLTKSNHMSTEESPLPQEEAKRVDDNFKNEIAQLYFQTGTCTDQTLPQGVGGDCGQTMKVHGASMSRNAPQSATSHHSKQYSGTFNSANIGSMFYQRTLASDRSSDLKRQHMTHNSDLIEQIGIEFVIVDQSQPSHPIYAIGGPDVMTSDPLLELASARLDHHHQHQVQQESQMLHDGGKGQIIAGRNNIHYQTQQPKKLIATQQAKTRQAVVIPVTQHTSSATMAAAAQVYSSRNVTESHHHGQVTPYSQQAQSNRQTKVNSRQSSRHKLKSSRPVSTTSNEAAGVQVRDPSYDVRAEGSIINIKRNTHGDPEMLILSSQKELKDLMSSQLSSGQPPKKSRSRSKGKSQRNHSSKQYKTAVNQSRCQKQLKQSSKQRPPKSAKSASRSLSTQRVGIRHGNLMTFRPSVNNGPAKSSNISPCRGSGTRQTKRFQYTTTVPHGKIHCWSPPVSNKFGSKRPSVKTVGRRQKMDLVESRLQRSSELKAFMSTSKSVQNLAVEQDLLKSLKSMRRENMVAKNDLKALYNHKLEKLKSQLEEEKRQGENEIKAKLKFAKHATDVQRQRARSFKHAADELSEIAKIQAQRNETLHRQQLHQQVRQGRHRTRLSTSGGGTGLVSRSVSHGRQSSLFGASMENQYQKKQTMFGPHGVTHKPGFSFVSKSLPRNNHNFVKGGSSTLASRTAIGQGQKSRGYFLRDCCLAKYLPNGGDASETTTIVKRADLSSLSDIHTETSLERMREEQMIERTTEQKDAKLMDDDFAICRVKDDMARGVVNNNHQVGNFSVTMVHQKCQVGDQFNDNKHQVSDKEGSHQTFGVGENAFSTVAVDHDYDDSNPELRTQKSLFDATTKTMMMSNQGGLSTPEGRHGNHHTQQQNQKQSLLKDLEKSGARFKCTSCKARKVEMELPCTRCFELNCNADDKKGGHRRHQWGDSNLSWDSSDLNSEYRDRPRGGVGRVFSSKLMQCSNDLIANQARLDQIQKILFQPKQPRQKSRGQRQATGQSASQASAVGRDTRGDTSEQSSSATLPEMIDRLRKSRQNLKY